MSNLATLKPIILVPLVVQVQPDQPAEGGSCGCGAAHGQGSGGGCKCASESGCGAGHDELL